MTPPSSSICDLARRLLALEAASATATEAGSDEAVRVCEKLRISLTRFAGADGFTALLRRAVVLARKDVPPLHVVQVRPDGRLEGLEGVVSESGNGGREAATAIVAHLLDLLCTFIGEPLTRRLASEAWPEASWGPEMSDEAMS